MDDNHSVTSVYEPSDGEHSTISRKGSKIPLANCKYNPLKSDRSKNAADKIGTKPLVLSPKLKIGLRDNSPKLTSKPKHLAVSNIKSQITSRSAVGNNSTRSEKQLKARNSTLTSDKSVRDLEIKLVSTKKKYAAMLDEITQKQSSAVLMRQEILSMTSKINELTGVEQPIDTCDASDVYNEKCSLIAELVSNLPEGWLNVALKFATNLKDIQKKGGYNFSADISDIEKEKMHTDEKIKVINAKIQEISLDASERIKAYEKLLKERLVDIQIESDRSTQLELDTKEIPNSGRTQKMWLLKYQDLLKKSREEKNRLEKEMEKKVSECQKATEELGKLMAALNDARTRNPSEFVLREKEHLNRELTDKSNLLSILSGENCKLKETIQQMSVSHKNLTNFPMNNGPQLQNKKIQAELDPQHRSARRQIQFLKFEMRRLELMNKKLLAADATIFTTDTDRPLGLLEGKQCALTQLKEIIKDENEEIKRLEKISLKIQEHQKKAKAEMAAIMNRKSAKMRNLKANKL